MQEMVSTAKEMELLSDELLLMVERFKIGAAVKAEAVAQDEPSVELA